MKYLTFCENNVEFEENGVVYRTDEVENTFSPVTCKLHRERM